MKERLPTLSSFAKMPNAFDQSKALYKRLLIEGTESKHLEWKLTPPVGNTLTQKAKYRYIKAAVAFANTEGGFIIFGVSDEGKWIGFTDNDLKECDPAKIYETINSNIHPELSQINYKVLLHRKRLFPIIHVCPSSLMPHMVVKEAHDKKFPGKSEVYLHKYAIYCRYGAKCDHATPTQIDRIMRYRTEQVRNELIRRVKEIELPVIQPFSPTINSDELHVREIQFTNDPSALKVRITRNPKESVGVLVQEKLSDQLFEDINHVLDSNFILSKNNMKFLLGEQIYYRIYAERYSADKKTQLYDLLFRTGSNNFLTVAPNYYWLSLLSPTDFSNNLRALYDTQKLSSLRTLVKICTLLGEDALHWLDAKLTPIWGSHPQPPEYYFTLHKTLKQGLKEDHRLNLLPVGSTISVDGEHIYLIRELLQNSTLASEQLSNVCFSIFEGKKELGPVSRQLDTIAYGRAIQDMTDSVLPLLLKT